MLKYLPPELHYLIEPALRFACRTEWDIVERLGGVSKHDIEYLRTVADVVLQQGHFSQVMRFLDEFPITAHDECAQLYFFFGLLDHGGFAFERAAGG